MRFLPARFAAPLISLMAAVAPSPAHACGGTFCDAPGGPSGPMVMSVDQRGENILFVLDGKSVEAHIQIQYTGDPAHFAWVIPVQQVPAFMVGSQALFDRLLGATVPTYGYTTTNACPGKNQGAAGAGGAGGGPGGPSVVYQAAVGAYEIHVLSGGTADGVQQWLGKNGYAPSPDAPPILQQYLEQGYLFVAVKLQPGAGVDRIHPIVIKVPGNKPCVPLRLTAVAAVENMTVRTFFLASTRVVPMNYKHVTPNPLRLDWLQFGNNYDTVIANAIDTPVADGHAFVTEYAGTSAVAAIAPTKWSSTPFQTVAPEGVMTELAKQSLATCSQGSCVYKHPLIQGILHQFLPVPSGVTEGEFYSNLPTYKGLIDTSVWDGPGFAGAFDELIVQPAKHATSVLDDHPYLTRMLTMISPAEMTEDPEFALRSGLGDVALPHVASLSKGCVCNKMTLPGGRVVDVTTGWPAWSAEMPWAESVVDMSTAGPPAVLVDNAADIDAELAKHQAGVSCTSPSNGAGGKGLGGYPGSNTGGQYGAAGKVSFAGHSGAGYGGAGHGGAGYGGAGYGGAPVDDSGDVIDSGSSSCAVGRGSSVSAWGLLIALGLYARRRRGRS